MVRDALWAVVVGAAVCLAGCSARRPTHATVLACVERATADRMSCFEGCQGEFEEAFVGCYGHDACTDRCQTQQLACQAGPLHDLALCAEAAENPSSCQAQFHGDLQACAGRPSRAACEDDARRRAVACWEACQSTHVPALERCAATVRTCLDGCVPR